MTPERSVYTLNTMFRSIIVEKQTPVTRIHFDEECEMHLKKTVFAGHADFIRT